MLPYGTQSINDDDVAAVETALRSDWLTTGPEVERFEHAIEAVVSTKAVHPRAVAVTSGTAALHAAYAAAHVESGTEIITTPLTFMATASTAALLGAKVVFADIDEATGLLDIEAAEAEATARTRVIAAVDFAGAPVDGEAFTALARRHRSWFLEDAAHSLGSTRDGVPVGAQADLTTLSFFPAKNATTAEGGAVVATDDDLIRGARSFRNHGIVREPAEQRIQNEGPWHQEVHEFGLNYRLPDVLAALGTSQLARLGEFKARRSRVFERYTEAFADLPEVTLPVREKNTDPMWHLFPLRVAASRRRAIFERLRERGIGVQVNYIPVYWHPVFEDLGYRRGLCPNAEEYYRREISLPMHATLSETDIDFVIDEVRRAVTA